MGAGKVGSDSISSGSFFHLLDWSKRARKKLFSSESASSEGKNQKKQDAHGDHSAAASSEICNGESSRAPGAVARLMGLNSLPTSGIFPPLHDSQLLEDVDRSQISSPVVYNRDDSGHVPKKNDIRSRKPVELQSRKMSSSRIERFHIDTLPSKLDKVVSDTHHKLLAGAKHPGLVSPKNATLSTRKVTNFLETELLNGKAGKSLSFKVSSSSPKGFHSKDIASTPKKKSTIADLATGTANPVAMGSPKGPPFSRRNNGSKITAAPRFFPDTIDATAGAKFDKSPSLVILSKTKTQRRESLRKKNGDTLMVEDNDKLNLQNILISPSNTKNVNKQRRTSARDPSTILRQNNEKQNHVSSKNNLAKPSPSNQQLKSALSGDATFCKKRVAEKLAYGFRKEVSESAEKKGLELKNIKLNENRKPATQGSNSRRNVSTGKRHMAGYGKQVRHNVVIDENARWRNYNQLNVVDVVSFTFTSPIRKSVDASKTTRSEANKLDASDKDKKDHDEITPNLVNNHLSSSDSNILSGDSLGKLIERKLLELTSGTYSPYHKLSTGATTSLSGSLMDDSASSAISSTFDAEHDMESLLSVCSDKIFGTFEPDYCLSTDDKSYMSHEPQEAESIDSYNTTLEIEELDCEDQFGVPDLESSFSNGSSYSSESSGSSIESKIDVHSASMVAVDTATGDSMNKTISLQSEMELFDSASYLSVETITGPAAAEFRNLLEEELDYLKYILSSISFTVEDLLIYPLEDSSFGILDPHIFVELEERSSMATVEGEEKQCRMERKMLFDSLNECLGLKSSQYFQAGYRSWAKGVAAVGGYGDLAEEVYRNISEWTSDTIGEWMVDELVERDLSTQSLRWINFKTEAYETAIELERGVFNSLIEEIVADLV